MCGCACACLMRAGYSPSMKWSPKSFPLAISCFVQHPHAAVELASISKVSDSSLPHLLCPPILGPLVTASAEDGKAEQLSVLLLVETSQAAELTISLNNVLTNETSEIRIRTPDRRPGIVQLGPVLHSCRYRYEMTGIDRPWEGVGTFSVCDSAIECNLVTTLGVFASTHTDSYDCVQDIANRVMLPFHGISGVVHIQPQVSFSLC